VSTRARRTRGRGRARGGRARGREGGVIRPRGSIGGAVGRDARARARAVCSRWEFRGTVELISSSSAPREETRARGASDGRRWDGREV
jgi:hypothetical protein